MDILRENLKIWGRSSTRTQVSINSDGLFLSAILQPFFYALTIKVNTEIPQNLFLSMHTYERTGKYVTSNSMNKQTISFANVVILIFLIEITFSQNTFTLFILRNALK